MWVVLQCGVGVLLADEGVFQWGRNHTHKHHHTVSLLAREGMFQWGRNHAHKHQHTVSLLAGADHCGWSQTMHAHNNAPTWSYSRRFSGSRSVSYAFEIS